MKKRYALVSNSSSSSFICHRPIAEVAYDMWEMVMRDWEQYPKKRAKEIFKKIKEFCKKEDVQSGEHGISFPSTNYETYIIIKDGICHIDTCNNHGFWDVEGMQGVNEDDSHEELEDKFFYAFHFPRNVLIKRGHGSLPRDSKIDLVCPECEEQWKKQDRSMITHNDYFYVDIKGNRYCSMHHCKLREEERIPENKNS